MMRVRWLLSSSLVLGSLATCAPEEMLPPQPEPCEAAGIKSSSRFPGGDAAGHPDPFSASAKGKARAARIRDRSWIKEPANARQKIQLDDFMLVNDRIVAYIEGPGTSDGYQGLGGDLLALEPVGPDGKPTGTSQYGETLLALSRQAVGPDTLSVLNDGQDGKAAIVRVNGLLRDIPFLGESFAALLGNAYDFPAALDYVLEPGAEQLKVRLSLMNTSNEALNLSNQQFIGFFHSSRGSRFTADRGFATPEGPLEWVGYDTGPESASFAFRLKTSPLGFVLARSGFEAYRGSGLKLGACEKKTVDYVEWIVASGGIDGLRAAIRRTDGDTSWRTVTGRVSDAMGTPISGAFVHVVDTKGAYRTRAQTDNSGTYTVNVPAEEVDLTVTRGGDTINQPKRLAKTENTANLTLPQAGKLALTITDAKSKKALPSRIQIIPTGSRAHIPESFGIPQPVDARAVMMFSQGTETLTLPPGSYRVIVSHGFEWAIHESMQTIEAGKEVQLPIELGQQIDSSGVMCADFHIHSYYSADSADPVPEKVLSAVADGLEIPVSSEHEWIIDFQPTVLRLGLGDWAFGMSSEELTTFTWGHFGVVPIQARPDRVNNGAVPWIGKKPDEVFRAVASLPEKPVLIVNHPRSDGVGGYFSAADFQRTTATGDPDLWSEQFGAIEAFNDSEFEGNRKYIVADWFALLNAGKKVWAVGSSDTHAIRSSPVGYPRTCLRFGHDDPRKLTQEAVRDSLRAGQATVSGGLYLTVEGPGGVGPGGTVTAMGDNLEFKVVVQAPRWLDASQLETIINGQTVNMSQLQEIVTPPGTAKRYEKIVAIKRTPQPNWVIFHAQAPAGRDLSPVYPGRIPFAVSNPIFF